MSKAPWADILWDEMLAGVEEWPDPGENPRILHYFDVGCPGFDPVQGDETNWCAAAVWFSLVVSGCKVPEHRPPTARSLLLQGHRVPPGEERPGDVIVLYRGLPTGWQGHTGVYVSPKLMLGGNQGNMMSIAPYDPSKLLGFRRPILMENEP